MKRNFWIILLLVIALVSCSPDGVGYECKDGICISIEFEGPVQAVEPVPFTITVKTDQDVSGLGVSVSGHLNVTIQDIDQKPEGAELVYKDEEMLGWRVDTKGGVEHVFTGLLVLAKPTKSYGINSYELLAAASKKSGFRVTDSFSIYLDAEGKQVDESKAMLESGTKYPLPPPPPDMTVVPETPFPTIVWPTETSLPTTTPTLPAYP